MASLTPGDLRFRQRGSSHADPDEFQGRSSPPPTEGSSTGRSSPTRASNLTGDAERGAGAVGTFCERFFRYCMGVQNDETEPGSGMAERRPSFTRLDPLEENDGEDEVDMKPPRDCCERMLRYWLSGKA